MSLLPVKFTSKIFIFFRISPRSGAPANMPAIYMLNEMKNSFLNVPLLS